MSTTWEVSWSVTPCLRWRKTIQGLNLEKTSAHRLGWPELEVFLAGILLIFWSTLVMAFEAFVALVIFFSDSDYLKLCLLTWFCMLSISMACLNFSCCSGLSCCCATSPPPPPSFFEAFPPFPENFISFQFVYSLSFVFGPFSHSPGSSFCQIFGNNKRCGPFFPFFPPWLLPSTTSPPFPFSSTWSFSAISNTLWKIVGNYQDRFNLINGYLGHGLVFLNHIYHFWEFTRIDSIWISRTWLGPFEIEFDNLRDGLLFLIYTHHLTSDFPSSIHGQREKWVRSYRIY